jgi:hypothetical protein
MLFFIGYLMGIVQKSFPLLHKVVLHYQIIPSCNTWHISAVSIVLKHLEPLKALFYYSLFKIRVFATLFSYFTLLTRRIEKWKYGKENSLFSKLVPNPSIAAARKYCPFFGRKQTLASYQRYRVHSVFCEFTVNSNIYLISSHSGNETSFGRRWNWKAAEVQDTWRGTVHYRVLRGIP